MNIHPFRSNYNLSEPSQITPKLNSPSYSTTAETLCSSLAKSPNASIPKVRNLSQQASINQNHRQDMLKMRKPQTKQSQNSPYLVIDNIKWDNREGIFTSEMELKVQYTVMKQLEENMTWKVTYLSSAYSDTYDQVLTQFETEENVIAASYPQKRQFKLTVQPPKWNLTPSKELFSITAVAISVFYKRQQFVKVGYYVHYQLPVLTKDEKTLLSKLEKQEFPQEKQDNKQNIYKTKNITKKNQKPCSPQGQRGNYQKQEKIIESVLQRTVRTILVDKARVTKFQIDWDKKMMRENQNQKSNQCHSQSLLQHQHLITEYIKPQRSNSFCDSYSS